jgi:hypothetical protein
VSVEMEVRCCCGDDVRNHGFVGHGDSVALPGAIGRRGYCGIGRAIGNVGGEGREDVVQLMQLGCSSQAFDDWFSGTCGITKPVEEKCANVTIA